MVFADIADTGLNNRLLPSTLYPFKKETNMKTTGALIGFITGLLIVRAFFLDPIQVIGWDIFWNNIFGAESDLIRMNPEAVWGTKTFFKCAIGSSAGALFGLFAGSYLQEWRDRTQKEALQRRM